MASCIFKKLIISYRIKTQTTKSKLKKCLRKLEKPMLYYLIKIKEQYTIDMDLKGMEKLLYSFLVLNKVVVEAHNFKGSQEGLEQVSIHLTYSNTSFKISVKMMKSLECFLEQAQRERVPKKIKCLEWLMMMIFLEHSVVWEEWVDSNK